MSGRAAGTAATERVAAGAVAPPAGRRSRRLAGLIGAEVPAGAAPSLMRAMGVGSAAHKAAVDAASRNSAAVRSQMNVTGAAATVRATMDALGPLGATVKNPALPSAANALLTARAAFNNAATRSASVVEPTSLKVAREMPAAKAGFAVVPKRIAVTNSAAMTAANMTFSERTVVDAAGLSGMARTFPSLAGALGRSASVKSPIDAVAGMKGSLGLAGAIQLGMSARIDTIATRYPGIPPVLAADEEQVRRMGKLAGRNLLDRTAHIDTIATRYPGIPSALAAHDEQVRRLRELGRGTGAWDLMRCTVTGRPYRPVALVENQDLGYDELDDFDLLEPDTHDITEIETRLTVVRHELLVGRLRELSPHLSDLLLGAHDDMNRRGPAAATKVAHCLYEVVRQTLAHLAPNDVVEAALANGELVDVHGIDYRNGPKNALTRSARAAFVYRGRLGSDRGRRELKAINQTLGLVFANASTSRHDVPGRSRRCSCCRRRSSLSSPGCC